MANPNIVNVASIYGQTFTATLDSASPTTAFSNAGASGSIYKINTILAANKHGTNAADISVWLVTPSGTTYIASTISIPADSALVILDKTASIYATEGMSVKAQASAAASIDLIVSYEVIS